MFAGAVDDHVDVISGVDDNGVVDDTAVGVGDKGEEAGVGGEAFYVADYDFFEEISAVFSVPADLDCVMSVYRGSV